MSYRIAVVPKSAVTVKRVPYHTIGVSDIRSYDDGETGFGVGVDAGDADALVDLILELTDVGDDADITGFGDIAQDCP